ncbi:MAG: hypothetical protein N2114_06755 [Candidatus Goldbacteria bacterium]|nr:hypothetical protein [Candidatus Goldiibacteriota bacterium]
MPRISDILSKNKNIKELEGQDFIITSARVEFRTYGGKEIPICILEVDGEEYYTFSAVIIDQIRRLKIMDYPVQARLVLVHKGKRTYYKLQ